MAVHRLVPHEPANLKAARGADPGIEHHTAADEGRGQHHAESWSCQQKNGSERVEEGQHRSEAQMNMSIPPSPQLSPWSSRTEHGSRRRQKSRRLLGRPTRSANANQSRRLNGSRHAEQMILLVKAEIALFLTDAHASCSTGRRDITTRRLRFSGFSTAARALRSKPRTFLAFLNHSIADASVNFLG